tara:strand:- start:82 stop:504 length:423 start_codon:yes stop_codon:yes gene_type:complete
MNSETILWSKLGGKFKEKEYNDTILYEDSDLSIIEYWGQRSGQRDYLIKEDSRIVICNKQNDRVYIGKVIKVIDKGTTTVNEYNKKGELKEYNIKLYKLIVSKNKEKKEGRTKNCLCEILNLSTMNSFERTHGITSHIKV